MFFSFVNLHTFFFLIDKFHTHVIVLKRLSSLITEWKLLTLCVDIDVEIKLYISDKVQYWRSTSTLKQKIINNTSLTLALK